MTDRTTAEKVDSEGGFDTYRAEYLITFSVPHETEDPEHAFLAWLSGSEEAKIELDLAATEPSYWDVYRTVTGMSTARAWDEGGYLLDEKGDDFPDIYFN